MRKIEMKNGYDDDKVRRVDVFVGDSNEIKLLYKSLCRNGQLGNMYPTFLDFPIFVEGRIYGVAIEYSRHKREANFNIVGERTIAGWYADGLI